MNKFLKSILFIFITGLVAYGVYYLRQKPKDKIPVKLVDKTITPQKFERVFRPVQLEQTSLGDSITKHVLNPADLIFKNGDLFVLDLSDEKVKQFNKDGHFVKAIGNGTGRGPGEMIHANDFFIKGQKLWIVDSNLMRVSRFNLNGQFEDSFSVDYHPVFITGNQENIFIITIAQEHVIKRLDYEGNQLGEFGHFLENQVQNPLSVAGRLTSYKKSVLFSPSIASLVYFYRADTLYQVARRPDGLSFKSSIDKSDEDRQMHMAPEANVEARTIIVDDDKLYILQFERADQEKQSQDNFSIKKSFIDVYQADSGQYKYTFDLPGKSLSTSMTIDDNLLVINKWDNNEMIVQSYKVSEF